MRIISGKKSGMKLIVPKFETRPTTSRVREAVFSSLGSTIINANFLDLFSGSGAMGLEALSRGAKEVTFVENNLVAESVIKGNLKSLGFTTNVKLIKNDVFIFLRKLRGNIKYDFIFADPPYQKDDRNKLMLFNLLNSNKLTEALNLNGVLILETSEFISESIPWETLEYKKYGKTKIYYLRAIK